MYFNDEIDIVMKENEKEINVPEGDVMIFQSLIYKLMK